MNEYELQIRQCEMELQNLADKIFLDEVPINKLQSVVNRISEIEKEIKHFKYLESYEPKNEIEKYI